MFLNKELNLAVIGLLVACSYVFGQPQVHDEEEQVNNNSTDTNSTAPIIQLSCGGKLSKTSNSDELYDIFLPHILSKSDSPTDILVKKDFLKYLTISEPFLDMIRCKILEPSSPGVPHHQKKKLQEDEDDDGDSGSSGTSRIPSNQFTDALDIIANGMGNRDPLDNSNVLIGVRRILQNVFSGNIVGVVNESVGLRSPEGVQNTFVDVLSTIFGSMATAGATGIIANSTGATSQKGEGSTEPNVYNLQQEEELGTLVEAQPVAAHQPTLWNQPQAGEVGSVAGAIQGGSIGGGVGGGAQQQLLLQQQQQLILQQQQQLEYIRTQQQIQKLQQAIQQAQGGAGLGLGGGVNSGRGDAVTAQRPQHVHQPQFPRKPIQPEFNRKPIQAVQFPQHPVRSSNIPIPPQQLRQGSIGS